MDKRFKRLKIACEIVKSQLFLKPGDLVIRTESKCGKFVGVQKVERVKS